MFASMSAVLRFALDARPVFEHGPLERFLPACGGDLPTGYDRVAQSAMILRRLGTLTELEQIYVVAVHGNPQLRDAARERLVCWVLPKLGSGAIPRRLVAELVAKACGKPGVRLNRLAVRWGVHVNTVSRWRARIQDALGPLANRASEGVYVQLRQAGFLED